MGKSLSILVIEDDMTSHAALVRLLKQSDFDVHSATTLREGLALLGTRPDCAILDLMLPDGNGVAALHEIRERNLPVKVAVTTGASDPEMIKAVERLVPDQFLTKPVEVSRLMAWLRDCQKNLGN